eukprot:PhM_4_TR9029/c0_g1_i1/m.105621
MQHHLATLTVAILICGSIILSADAKGISSSSFGGSARAYKRGYYSRSSRYYVGYMYWGSGGYRGQRYRTVGSNAGAAPNPDIMDKAFCGRTVSLDAAVGKLPDWYGNKIFVVNSTQTCYQQLDAQPGSPKNIPILDVMLTRFQFEFNANLGGSKSRVPSLIMRIFPDMDVPAPSLTVGIQLLNIHVRNAAGAILRTVDLKQTTFKYCTSFNGCLDLDGMYPQLTRMDFAPMFTWNLVATIDKDTNVSFTPVLSGDFAEDADDKHFFLRPSAIKFDVKIEMKSLVQAYAELEAIVYAPTSGSGSNVFAAEATGGRTAMEYDPRAMTRIVMGDPSDSYQAYLSYWSSMDPDKLCTAVGNGSSCVVLASTAMTKTCPGAADCDATLSATMSGYKITWLFQQDVREWTDGAAEWYFDLGYADPAEITDTSAGVGLFSSTPMATLMVSLVVAVLLL